MFSQAVSFIGTLLVTWLYGPFEVGIFGIFFACFALAVFAASWRYELAIVTVDDDQEANDIALFVVGAGAASAIGALVTIILIEHLLDADTLSQPVRRALAALPICMILASAILAGTSICARQRRFSLVAIHQVVLTLASLMAQVLLVHAELPTGGLVAGFITGQICALLIFARPLSNSLLASARRASILLRMRTVAVRHNHHFFYTVPYSLVTQFYYQLPVLLLGALFGAREAGFFSVAFRTTFTPIALLPTALAQVFFPEMARERDQLKRWEDRLLAFLVALGILLAPAAAILIVFGPDLYATVLGEAWRDAGTFAQIMIVANLINGLCTGYDRIYFVLNRQRAALAIICMVTCLSVSLMLSGGWGTHTAVGLVVGWTFGHLALAVVWASVIYRIAGFSVRALVNRWLIVIAVVSALAGVLALGKAFDFSNMLATVVLVVIVIVYGLAVWRVLHPIAALRRRPDD